MMKVPKSSAPDIAGASLDYDGHVTLRLAGADGAVVTIAGYKTHHGSTDLTTFTASWSGSSRSCRTLRAPASAVSRLTVNAVHATVNIVARN
jgi:hypothetical protein